MLPSEIYSQRVEVGLLAPDEAQARVMPLLDHVVRDVQRPATRKSLLRALFTVEPQSRGLYLYGPVGRGKSFLMDLLYECVPPIVPKRRIHFHQFMRDVHQRLNNLRLNNVDDPLSVVAEGIANEVRLLCFDEMFVKDVADAMILSRLFTQLYDKGVIVVATSNIMPDDLYANGLQRVRFLPFIDILKAHSVVVNVAGDVDHRQALLLGVRSYHYPLGPISTAALQGVFDRLTYGASPVPMDLLVDGRVLTLRRTARGVLHTTFEEICASPLGPVDMLEIAACFNSVIMDGVPQFTPEMRNEMTRFITLIDALYDARRLFFMAAAAPLEALYPKGDYVFDFQRTASRITEMQARDYQKSLFIAEQA